jgi:hypothetical protein
MSNAPENQNPQVQNDQYSSQGKTAQVGNNIKKDEPTAQSGKDRMKNEGGNASTSGKSSQTDTKPSDA